RNACGVSLYGVHAVSPTDVWAVGDSTTCHYNGTRWSIIPSPQPRGQYNEIAYVLTDVSSTGPGDVWASGYRVIEQREYLAVQVRGHGGRRYRCGRGHRLLVRT